MQRGNAMYFEMITNKEPYFSILSSIILWGRHLKLSSFQGFDYEGNDPFWTVTGDNVTSLILTDYTKVRDSIMLYSERRRQCHSLNTHGLYQGEDFKTTHCKGTVS